MTIHHVNCHCADCLESLPVEERFERWWNSIIWEAEVKSKDIAKASFIEGSKIQRNSYVSALKNALIQFRGEEKEYQ